MGWDDGSMFQPECRLDGDEKTCSLNAVLAAATTTATEGFFLEPLLMVQHPHHQSKSAALRQVPQEARGWPVTKHSLWHGRYKYNEVVFEYMSSNHIKPLDEVLVMSPAIDKASDAIICQLVAEGRGLC